MAKSTIFFIFILSILAALLLGINVGKKIEKAQLAASPFPTVIPTASVPTTRPTPLLTASPSVSVTIKTTTGKSTYSDRTCGFEFSYPGSYLQQKSVNGQAIIITDPNDPSATIAATCATEIPKPPLPPEKIETITLDGITATLYHDTSSKDGSPRDEVIVKHPTNEKEIIIAGFGPAFQATITSFKFVR